MIWDNAAKFNLSVPNLSQGLERFQIILKWLSPLIEQGNELPIDEYLVSVLAGDLFGNAYTF